MSTSVIILQPTSGGRNSVRFTMDPDFVGYAHIRCSSPGGVFSVFATPEEQRELFNWLGIQLHKHENTL